MLFHFDFYRLKHAGELQEIGFVEYLRRDGICLIEWADMFPDVLPQNINRIVIEDMGNNTRNVQID
jgi:tRNA threonylcarbamoyladenosine biosynthesis protein TsaE